MPDPASITPLLAERLDISTDRAETLLQSMLQELKSRAASEGVHLSELGTFEEEDGTLRFIPSPSLRRRVNHQFEGLSPEDLSGPPSARPEAEAPPSLRESAREEPAPGRDPSSSEADEDIPTIDPIDEDDESEPAAPSDETPAEPDHSPAQPENSTEESIPTLDPIEDDNDGEDTDASGPDESEEPEKAPPEEDEEDEEEPASPIGTYPVISTLVLFVILLGIGWFVLTETNLWSAGPPSYETSDTEMTQSAEDQEPSQSADPDRTDDASNDNQPDRYAGVQPGDQSGDTPNPAADTGTGTWTVVVAALSSRTEAEAMAEEYEDHFDSVEVLPTTVSDGNQDRTLYRVTVGRYDSEVAAERIRRENASLMPSDAWIHELQ